RFRCCAIGTTAPRETFCAPCATAPAGVSPRCSAPTSTARMPTTSISTWAAAAPAGRLRGAPREPVRPPRRSTAYESIGRGRDDMADQGALERVTRLARLLDAQFAIPG